MHKRGLFFIVGIAAIAVTLTGCGTGSSSGEASSGAAVKEAAENLKEDAVYGKVTAIAGEKITVDIVTMEQPKAMPEGSSVPEGKDGEEPPSRPEGSGAPEGKDGEEPPSRPKGSGAPAEKDGKEPPNQPRESGAPDATGRPDRGMGVTSTGESRNITLSDGVTIQTFAGDGNTENASLEDITEGSLLRLTYDGDELTEVTIYR